jgi:hypothetical protein
MKFLTQRAQGKPYPTLPISRTEMERVKNTDKKNRLPQGSREKKKRVFYNQGHHPPRTGTRGARRKELATKVKRIFTTKVTMEHKGKKKNIYPRSRKQGKA